MNILKPAILACSVLTLTVLSACGTMTAGMIGAHTRYADVTEGKTAKLRIRYDQFDQIHIFPNGTCIGNPDDKNAGRAISKPIAKDQINIISANSVTFEEKLLGMPFPPFELKKDMSNVYSEFYIPAEKDFLVRMSYAYSSGSYMSSCPIKHFLMNAKEGHHYELQLLKTSGVCLYSMSEIGDDGVRKPVDTWRPTHRQKCSAAHKSAPAVTSTNTL